MLSRLKTFANAPGFARCMSSFFHDPLNFVEGKRVFPTGQNSSEALKVLDPSTGEFTELHHR